MNKIIPKWIVLYLWFLTIMTILFTLMSYFMPEIHDYVESYSFGSDSAMSLYLSRNIAIIVIYLFAIFSNRIIVFKSVFILRSVIDLIDLVQNIIQFDILGIPASLILLSLDIFAITKLYKLKK